MRRSGGGGGGGGGGVAFSERRRAYGPGASRWGGGRLPFVPSGAGFLLVIGGVWVTVLVLFSTAFYADTRHAASSSPLSSSWSFLGGEKGGSSSSRSVEGTGLQALQSQVKELSQRVKALSKQQERPPLEVGTAAAVSAAVSAAAGAGGKGSEKKGGSVERGQYAVKPQGPGDSSTSERPLVDPTVLARSRPAFAHDDMGTLCGRRNNGDEEVLDRVEVWEGAEMGRPRILCLTYTLSKAQAAVEGVRQTWGQRCDGYIAMSDVTDKAIPSVDIKHDGPEAYENMWQKIRAIWMYVYRHHLHDFDYFVSGGDDLFLIVENLRKYLLSEEIQQASDRGRKPLFLGRPFLPPHETHVFNSGGAGLFLNAKALELLGKGLNTDLNCRPHEVGFWEDMNVAHCLREHAGVVPYNNTQDAWGRERFNPFTPGNHLYYRVNKHNPDWYAKYTFNLREGLDCCSSDSISFHYVKGEAMKRYHALLHGMCDSVSPDRKQRREEAQAAIRAEQAKGPPTAEELKGTYKGLGEH